MDYDAYDFDDYEDDATPIDREGMIDLVQAEHRTAKALEGLLRETKSITARLDLILQILNDGACIPTSNDLNPALTPIEKRAREIMNDPDLNMADPMWDDDLQYRTGDVIQDFAHETIIS